MSRPCAAVLFALVASVAPGCRGSDSSAPNDGAWIGEVRPDGWVEVTSRPLRIRAQFPSMPKYHGESTVADQGSATLGVFTVKHEDAGFMLTIVDWPINLETRDVDKILAAGVVSGLRRLHAPKVLSDELIEVDGHRGRRTVVETVTKEGEKRVLEWASFIAGSRLITAMAEHPAGAKASEDAARFLASLDSLD